MTPLGRGNAAVANHLRFLRNNRDPFFPITPWAAFCQRCLVLDSTLDFTLDSKVEFGY